MPELPDITVYIEALESRIKGETLLGTRIANPFVLRSVEPPLSAAHDRQVTGLRRMGKRIIFEFEDDLFLVLHLMIAGRLRWLEANARIPGKLGLAAFDFPSGTRILTEAGSKRRASLSLVRGVAGLEQFARGGMEVMEGSLEEFSARLNQENHTLKRSLTDPRLFSGIGNAYSDEILHRARLSPVRHTRRLSAAEIERLFAATRETLAEWTARLRERSNGDFPKQVTAFQEGMAVHGRFGKPCPVCAMPVQRIRYADNETNYCARCQTDGKLLADRALSRLLRQDWPRSIDDLAES